MAVTMFITRVALVLLLTSGYAYAAINDCTTGLATACTNLKCFPTQTLTCVNKKCVCRDNPTTTTTTTAATTVTTTAAPNILGAILPFLLLTILLPALFGGFGLTGTSGFTGTGFTGTGLF